MSIAPPVTVTAAPERIKPCWLLTLPPLAFRAILPSTWICPFWFCKPLWVRSSADLPTTWPPRLSSWPTLPVMLPAAPR
ncbi:hypothetical protein D3C81_1053920 [compost metagenome]